MQQSLRVEDSRQASIYGRLHLVGSGPVRLFLDACIFMSRDIIDPVVEYAVLDGLGYERTDSWDGAKG